MNLTSITSSMKTYTTILKWKKSGSLFVNQLWPKLLTKLLFPSIVSWKNLQMSNFQLNLLETNSIWYLLMGRNGTVVVTILTKLAFFVVILPKFWWVWNRNFWHISTRAGNSILSEEMKWRKNTIINEKPAETWKSDSLWVI